MGDKETSTGKTGAVYIPQGAELDVAFTCFQLHYPLMLRGPTGVGKTTLVSHLANSLNLPQITQSCNEDTLAADLIGRNLHTGWIDGSATKSLRYKSGAIYYMDEIGEARQDVIVVVHSLSDDRRMLEVLAHDENLDAPNNWMLVASYNPFYQLQNKVKPSTAQRFITVDIPHPADKVENIIVSNYLAGFKEIKGTVKKQQYARNDSPPVDKLVILANDFRRMAGADSMGLREGPGTGLVARTARLIEYGLHSILAIEVGMINPLTYEPDQKLALFDVARKLFK